MDSLGFVTDDDEEEDVAKDFGQIVAAAQTHRTQHNVTSQLDREGRDSTLYDVRYQAGLGNVQVEWSYGQGYSNDPDEGKQGEVGGGDDDFRATEYYLQTQGGHHPQHRQYEQYQHTGIHGHEHNHHHHHHHAQYTEGAFPHPAGFSQYQRYQPPHHYQYYHPEQQQPQEHGGGKSVFFHGDRGNGSDGSGGHAVGGFRYTWEGVAAGGYAVNPDDLCDMDEHEFLNFLQESFPGYSLESLEELLAVNNNDISLTVQMLTDFDVEEKTVEPPALDDESNFPTLGIRDKKRSGAAQDGAADGESSDERPPSPPTEIFKSFTISGGRSNVRGTSPVGHHLSTTDENVNFADRLMMQTSQVPNDNGVTERGGVQIGYGAGRFGGQRSRAAQQPWVETGEAVSNLYTSTREDARDHMRLRNICFQQATQAYLTGNKALAKELSRKGRNHAQAMKAAHNEAAGAIFRERNSNILKGNNGQSGPRMFDLHGLHVAEAVSVLRQELPKCRVEGEAVVHILVGTGHHVKGPRTPARLPAAVAEYLRASQIHFWEPQPGMIEVDVASVSA